MLSERTTESVVGIFLLAAMAALIILAFKISGLTSFFKPEGYDVTAVFDEIGQLKVRAPIKMGGVTIGEVTDIQLDPITFKAVVHMRINQKINTIPTDSSASILTAGLLGDNYVAITPMYNTDYLKQGSEIEETHPAIILEKLIGQFMFKIGNTASTNTETENASTNTKIGNASTNIETENASTNTKTGNASTNTETENASTNTKIGNASTNTEKESASTNTKTGNASTNIETGNTSTNTATKNEGVQQ
jgi:phospholipid/cholesterol/gamma-HCH transport system substrate-binding protein